MVSIKPASAYNQGLNVNVKDFGAAGDGVTDDTAAIQAAIEFVKARRTRFSNSYTFGKIFFPVGEYICTNGLHLASTYGIELYGEGGYGLSSSKIVMTTNTSSYTNTTYALPIFLNCRGTTAMTIRDMGVFYSDSSGFTGVLIDFEHDPDDPSGSDASCITISNCTVGNLAGVQTATTLINFNAAIIANVNQCLIRGSAQYGISGSHAGWYSNSITIDQCSFDHCGEQTTIAVASNGASLPQSTINVASTANFPSAGQIIVQTDAGNEIVTYTGKTSTTFTGCTGGTGMMTTSNAVRWGAATANAIEKWRVTNCTFEGNVQAYVSNRDVVAVTNLTFSHNWLGDSALQNNPVVEFTVNTGGLSDGSFIGNSWEDGTNALAISFAGGGRNVLVTGGECNIDLCSTAMIGVVVLGGIQPLNVSNAIGLIRLGGSEHPQGGGTNYMQDYFQFAGHIETKPIFDTVVTVQVGTGAGSGATISVDGTSNDTAGAVFLTTGTGCRSSIDTGMPLFTITTTKPYGAGIPHVYIQQRFVNFTFAMSQTPLPLRLVTCNEGNNSNHGLIQVYSYDIPSDSTEYAWDYLVVV